MSAHPNTSQADRDRLADPDLPDLDDRVGTGAGAQHDEEVLAQ
ncbi:hypothetical protein [Mycolicibacterium lutetiense]|uniref:Uncharacterized protein n=1 Tax=Mycolicibacterium lutetiense TaxID=1641992 RepID=A0ABS4ZSP0_9MYCO|nr:hypothetical protein [Mycolicibacterium lutetiense]MBP2452522.1 hypothetical protein [Mycolicibacterium lutetiense]